MQVRSAAGGQPRRAPAQPVRLGLGGLVACPCGPSVLGRRPARALPPPWSLPTPWGSPQAFVILRPSSPGAPHPPTSALGSLAGSQLAMFSSRAAAAACCRSCCSRMSLHTKGEKARRAGHAGRFGRGHRKGRLASMQCPHCNVRPGFACRALRPASCAHFSILVSMSTRACKGSRQTDPHVRDEVRARRQLAHPAWRGNGIVHQRPALQLCTAHAVQFSCAHNCQPHQMIEPRHASKAALVGKRHRLRPPGRASPGL